MYMVCSFSLSLFLCMYSTISVNNNTNNSSSAITLKLQHSPFIFIGLASLPPFASPVIASEAFQGREINIHNSLMEFAPVKSDDDC